MLAELDRLSRQLVVRQSLHLRLERIDRRHDRLETAHLLAFARAKYLSEHTHDRPLYAAPPAIRVGRALSRPGGQPSGGGHRDPLADAPSMLGLDRHDRPDDMVRG